MHGDGDTVVDGVTGLLSGTRGPRALGEAIERASRPALRAPLAAAARATAAGHEPCVVVAAHLDAYEAPRGRDWRCASATRGRA